MHVSTSFLQQECASVAPGLPFWLFWFSGSHTLTAVWKEGHILSTLFSVTFSGFLNRALTLKKKMIYSSHSLHPAGLIKVRWRVVLGDSLCVRYYFIYFRINKRDPFLKELKKQHYREWEKKGKILTLFSQNSWLLGKIRSAVN